MLSSHRIRLSVLVSLALVVLGSTLLVWINSHNFILFHSLIKVFSAIIYAAIFAVIFNTRNLVRDGFSSLLRYLLRS